MANRKKQEVFVPALSEEMKECPLIIRDIGATVSGYFEVASEVSFANEEDEQIIDLLIRLYIGGRYHEAVMLLRVVFSLIEYEEAQAILSLIHEKNGSNTEELFIKAFLSSSLRCEVSRIKALMDEENREEEKDHDSSNAKFTISITNDIRNAADAADAGAEAAGYELLSEEDIAKEYE